MLGLGDSSLVGPWGLKSISVVGVVLYDPLCGQLENCRVGPSPRALSDVSKQMNGINFGGK